jgi:hypothetical protein
MSHKSVLSESGEFSENISRDIEWFTDNSQKPQFAVGPDTAHRILIAPTILGTIKLFERARIPGFRNDQDLPKKWRDHRYPNGSKIVFSLNNGSVSKAACSEN